jgi:hypothetical protein
MVRSWANYFVLSQSVHRWKKDFQALATSREKIYDMSQWMGTLQFLTRKSSHKFLKKLRLLDLKNNLLNLAVVLQVVMSKQNNLQFVCELVIIHLYRSLCINFKVLPSHKPVCFKLHFSSFSQCCYRLSVLSHSPCFFFYMYVKHC